MDISKIPAGQQEKYLVENIFKVLKEYGHAMSSDEIKEALSDRDDDIAEFMKFERISKKTKNLTIRFSLNFTLPRRI